jgi:hypothetical protein
MAKSNYADIESAHQVRSDIMMADYLRYGPKYHHSCLNRTLDLFSNIKVLISRGDV